MERSRATTFSGRAASDRRGSASPTQYQVGSSSRNILLLRLRRYRPYQLGETLRGKSNIRLSDSSVCPQLVARVQKLMAEGIRRNAMLCINNIAA